MRELDQNEVKIVRELIKNTRISDNKIAKKTNVPVMTVNRKRKKLEKEGLLKYFTSLDTGEHGTGMFKAKQLYIIKFKLGITRQQYMESVEYDKKWMGFNADYISLSYLGEKDGHLALILILDAEIESELVDEFNNRIIMHIKEKLGENAIIEVITTRVTDTIRRHHNYLPSINMENGIMKKEWCDEWIFVDKSKTWNNSKK
ncbi:winged helix-turn-helix transcriptional regulator [Candidatus Woesearchaeota archaeon]|nr:winged helix-turn-helix transcriptional regulator [Candidatus Woesearchaeota archaeon]